MELEKETHLNGTRLIETCSVFTHTNTTITNGHLIIYSTATVYIHSCCSLMKVHSNIEATKHMNSL